MIRTLHGGLLQWRDQSLNALEYQWKEVTSFTHTQLMVSKYDNPSCRVLGLRSIVTTTEYRQAMEQCHSPRVPVSFLLTLPHIFCPSICLEGCQQPS